MFRPLFPLVLIAGTAAAAELKAPTVEAFDRYIRQVETSLNQRRNFLWVDESPDRLKRARGGEVVVEPSGEKAIVPVPDGLVHDWTGCVFVAGAALPQIIEQVQDYGRAQSLHHEVLQSRILSRRGNDFHVFMRLLKKKIITVVLDTEHDVEYTPIDQTHWKSHSKTTRIAEVQNAGKADESELPPGTGQGFLWRLDTYWRFEQRDGGTFIECRAISLTRDIPTGLGWLIEPIIRTLPKESLENTLQETAAAESARAEKGH